MPKNHYNITEDLLEIKRKKKTFRQKLISPKISPKINLKKIHFCFRPKFHQFFNHYNITEDSSEKKVEKKIKKNISPKIKFHQKPSKINLKKIHFCFLPKFHQTLNQT